MQNAFHPIFVHFIDGQTKAIKKRPSNWKAPFTRTLYENEKNLLFQIQFKYRCSRSPGEIIVVNLSKLVVNLYKKEMSQYLL